MVLGICIFYLNLVNGFSGQQPIESLVYALINVNITTMVICNYIVLEVTVNKTKYATNLAAEDKMPYTVSDLYSYTRSSIKKFYQSYFAYLLYAFYTGAVIFIVYYMGIIEGSIMLQNGWTQDLFSFGIFCVMTFVLQHHIHVAFMVRNWSLIFFILTIVSVAQLFITMIGGEMMMSS